MTGQGSGMRTAMLSRLERYAALRAAGTRPADAATEVGVSQRTGHGYENWYQRERLGRPELPASLRRGGSW
jgi:hypothetical protein